MKIVLISGFVKIKVIGDFLKVFLVERYGEKYLFQRVEREKGEKVQKSIDIYFKDFCQNKLSLCREIFELELQICQLYIYK